MVTLYRREATGPLLNTVVGIPVRFARATNCCCPLPNVYDCETVQFPTSPICATTVYDVPLPIQITSNTSYPGSQGTIIISGVTPAGWPGTRLCDNVLPAETIDCCDAVDGTYILGKASVVQCDWIWSHTITEIWCRCGYDDSEDFVTATMAAYLVRELNGNLRWLITITYGNGEAILLGEILQGSQTLEYWSPPLLAINGVYQTHADTFGQPFPMTKVTDCASTFPPINSTNPLCTWPATLQWFPPQNAP